MTTLDSHSETSFEMYRGVLFRREIHPHMPVMAIIHLGIVAAVALFSFMAVH